MGLSLGGKLRSLVAGFILSALVLTGCSEAGEIEASEPDDVSSSFEVHEDVGEWVDACKNYAGSPAEDFEGAYHEVIVDMCAKANPDGYSVPHELSPTVSVVNASRYLDSELFHESYWANYMPADFPRKMRVVFTEDDESWWLDQQRKHLIDPDLGWFTSTTEGWHCRVEPDIYCPKLFSPKETKNGVSTEFRIIGSELAWQNWQRTNSAHEMVHLYQDAHEQSHWAFWYVEGQATFFELAAARLLLKTDELRTGLVIDNPRTNDSLKFDPSSTAKIVQYFDDCNWSKDGGCDSFKYGVGSLFHEKLVIDHGLEKYWEWQLYLNANMPKGNPGNFTNSETESMFRTFDQSFMDVFGFSRNEFEQRVMPQYVYAYFQRVG
jgi:hypothetical protein